MTAITYIPDSLLSKWLCAQSGRNSPINGAKSTLFLNEATQTLKFAKTLHLTALRNKTLGNARTIVVMMKSDKRQEFEVRDRKGDEKQRGIINANLSLRGTLKSARKRYVPTGLMKYDKNSHTGGASHRYSHVEIRYFYAIHAAW